MKSTGSPSKSSRSKAPRRTTARGAARTTTRRSTTRACTPEQRHPQRRNSPTSGEFSLASCLEQALDRGERSGIWGGLTDHERQHFRIGRPVTLCQAQCDRYTGGSFGPPIRTSSRRRVTPRASSSATSGSTYLRLAPVASRNWATVKPSACSASSSAAT